MKTYSKLPLRERIDIDLAAIQSELERLQDSDSWDAEVRQSQLIRDKENLLRQAQHYDREVALGYKHPTTHRWGADGQSKNPFPDISSGMGETIPLDD